MPHEKSENCQLVLLHQVVKPLEMGNDALQCAVTSVSIQLAAIEA